ncbi:MAG: 5-carboxymethyl-2-hydroxymuconate Delta-isomerase [bacterium]
MPHLTLEYTSNIHLEVDFQTLFLELHQVLERVGGIEIENCKSRARRVEEYLVGDGSGNQAFVHLEVRFLTGRPLELKRKIGEALLSRVHSCYQAAMTPTGVQITVEMREMEREAYFKLPASARRS